MARLADFWGAALGYVKHEAPPDFMEAWLASGGDPNGAAAIVDPEGKGPRLFFEKKTKTPTTTIPIHLDLSAADREAEVQRLVGLVHTQRGLCVMGYSSFHETSNICPEIVGKGARMPRSRAALQGDFRDASLPDTARQRPRQLAAQDSRESRVRLADGVRNAIRTFNEKGLDALIAGSSTPKRVYPAFDANSAERLRGMLHRSPREFGYETSLWTLEMAAEAAFEEGLTEKRVSGETIRATLSRLLGIRWQRAKRWITSPDPLYERKKGGASD
jgi:hypothetical protein